LAPSSYDRCNLMLPRNDRDQTTLQLGGQERLHHPESAGTGSFREGSNPLSNRKGEEKSNGGRTVAALQQHNNPLITLSLITTYNTPQKTNGEGGIRSCPLRSISRNAVFRRKSVSHRELGATIRYGVCTIPARFATRRIGQSVGQSGNGRC